MHRTIIWFQASYFSNDAWDFNYCWTPCLCYYSCKILPLTSLYMLLRLCTPIHRFCDASYYYYYYYHTHISRDKRPPLERRFTRSDYKQHWNTLCRPNLIIHYLLRYNTLPGRKIHSKTQLIEIILSFPST